MPPHFEQEAFFGQLQHIITLDLPTNGSPRLGVDAGKTLVLVDVRTCKTNATFSHTPPGIPCYEKYEPNQIVDMNSVQCLVGRVQFTTSSGQVLWAIIDRTPDDNRAVWIDEDGRGVTCNTHDN